MSKFKTKKIVSIAALVLCLALIATFVLVFAGCDEEDAKGSTIFEGSVVWDDEYKFGRIWGTDWPPSDDSEIVETAYVENADATRTSEFDENGVATCIYGGEEMYLTLGGGVYDFYPYTRTLAPTSKSKNADDGLQMSLIFDEEPAYKSKTFSIEPTFFELTSLTGDALVVKAAESYQDKRYATYESRGYELEISSMEWIMDLEEAENSTSAVKIYDASKSIRSAGGHAAVHIELDGGVSYTYWYGSFYDLDLMDDDEEEIEEEEIEEENIETENEDYMLYFAA